MPASSIAITAASANPNVATAAAWSATSATARTTSSAIVSIFIATITPAATSNAVATTWHARTSSSKCASDTCDHFASNASYDAPSYASPNAWTVAVESRCADSTLSANSRTCEANSRTLSSFTVGQLMPMNDNSDTTSPGSSIAMRYLPRNSMRTRT